MEASRLDPEKYQSDSRIDSAGHRVWTVLAWTAPAVVLLLVFAFLDVPLIRSDGLGYYSWLHTIVHDRDMSLTNELAHFQDAVPHFNQLYVVPETGEVGTPFAFGSAFLWAPVYRAVLWLAQAEGATAWFAEHFDEEAYIALQGVGFLPGLAVTLGTNLLVLASVYLAIDIARRWVPLSVASLSALALFLGTPLVYYSTIEPSMSHAPGTFSVTLVFWLWLRFGIGEGEAGQRKDWVWLSIGLTQGLAITVRWQLALLGVPLGLVLVYQRRWRALLVFGLGTALLAWTVPWAWNQMFGQPFVTPASYGNPSSFWAGPGNLFNVWFSPLRGLFAWSPVVALAVIGFFLQAKRHPVAVAVAAGTFLLQSTMSASVWDWWAGWSFGMRRLVELYPLYVLGLGLLVACVGQRAASLDVSAALRRGLRLLPLGMTALAVLWSIMLLVTYTSSSIDPEWGTAGDALRHWGRCSIRCAASIAEQLYQSLGILNWRTPLGAPRETLLAPDGLEGGEEGYGMSGAQELWRGSGHQFGLGGWSLRLAASSLPRLARPRGMSECQSTGDRSLGAAREGLPKHLWADLWYRAARDALPSRDPHCLIPSRSMSWSVGPVLSWVRTLKQGGHDADLRRRSSARQLEEFRLY